MPCSFEMMQDSESPEAWQQSDSDVAEIEVRPPCRLPTTPPVLPFGLLGLLNNATFVIMIASAKSISEGGTALVFLASVFPGLLVKLSAPYWFERVSYARRLMAATVLMAGCFIVVGTFSGGAGAEGRVGMQLLGVGLCSLQGSLGEASLLALAGRHDDSCVGDAPAAAAGEDGRSKGRCITAFSSGTGLAGVFGFAYKVLVNEVLGLSLRVTLYLAIVFAAMYWHCYYHYLDGIEPSIGGVAGGAHSGIASIESSDGAEEGCLLPEGGGGGAGDGGLELPPGYRGLKWSVEGSAALDHHKEVHHLSDAGDVDHNHLRGGDADYADEWNDEYAQCAHDSSDSITSPHRHDVDIATLTPLQRLRLSASFWPYMVPLFTVYAAEYALQSGTWTSIGFPVDSAEARDEFYEYSNWTYQLGVFVSRSSGTFYQAPMSVLWIMPLMQCVNLVLFSYVASTHFWYDYTLLFPAFFVGLLGGAVYVNGYLRINADMPKPIREFALSTVSVADTFGVICANILGLYIQSCLYHTNGIQGAVVACPVE